MALLIFYKDPEVAEAFKDISSNPANIVKYQHNPKVDNVFETMKRRLGSTPLPNPDSEPEPMVILIFVF